MEIPENEEVETKMTLREIVNTPYAKLPAHLATIKREYVKKAKSIR